MVTWRAPADTHSSVEVSGEGVCDLNDSPTTSVIRQLASESRVQTHQKVCAGDRKGKPLMGVSLGCTGLDYFRGPSAA